MSYSSQALLSVDPDFIARISACAAVEVPKTAQPQSWATDHVWWISAAPGLADQYQYALDTNVDRPGDNPAVITDGQILAAVQHLISELQP